VVLLPSELSVVLRAVLPPLFTAYAIFVAMAAVAWRRPVPRPRGSGDDAVAPSLAHVARGIVGGYVAFLAIVLIFHVWLAEDPAAFVSAAGGGAFLCGVVMVVAAGWSLIQRRRPRHR
jgi:hypothetical protein